MKRARVRRPCLGGLKRTRSSPFFRRLSFFFLCKTENTSLSNLPNRNNRIVTETIETTREKAENSVILLVSLVRRENVSRCRFEAPLSRCSREHRLMNPARDNERPLLEQPSALYAEDNFIMGLVAGFFRDVVAAD